MILENIVLLGFVDSAVEYLDNEFKYEGKPAYLNDLNIVDLCNIRDDLNERINNTLNADKETIKALKQTGSDAFKRFLDDRKNNFSLMDEINDLFEEVEEPTEEKNEALGLEDIRDLLAFYNINDNLEGKDDIEEEIKEVEEENIYSDFVEDDIFRKISAASAKLKEEEENEAIDIDIDALFSDVIDQPTEAFNQNEIDEIFDEIVNSELIQDDIPEVNEEEIKEEENEVFVSSLIEELRKGLLKEEEDKKKELVQKNSIYDQINAMYPYLSQGFIRAVYDLKENIAIEYPPSVNLIILHRIVFSSLEDLRQFVEIVLGHDYNVNVDEGRLIVDVFKEHYNTDGKIITNIFEIANQAKLLSGEYDGYKVITEEE